MKKIPTSVLVIIYSSNALFLLLERADKPGYWQSVTGSLDFPEELPLMAAVRELREETGFHVAASVKKGLRDLTVGELFQPWMIYSWPFSVQYEIFEHWRHRYPAGVTHNTEHWFGVCVPQDAAPVLAPTEHVGYAWLNAEQAAARCFSPSNAQAILEMAEKLKTAHLKLPS